MHLEDERLAAGDDEPFSADELAHLACCGECRRELRAHRALMSLASAVAPAPETPRLIEWEALASALRQEGLLGGALPDAAAAVHVAGGDHVLRPVPALARSASSALPRSLARRGGSKWLRVAAAAVLVVGGAGLGRVTATMPFTPGTSSEGPGTQASVAGGGDAFGSVQQASDQLYRAQRDYERASLWLAANAPTMHSSDVYRARLAALDQMMTASRAALREAPQDPVLNHYFLSAYTAREGSLKSLGGALPVDKTLERY